MNRTVPHQKTLTILLSLSVLAHTAKTEAPLPPPMSTEVELTAEEQKLQQKLGEAGPRSAWINTDDLNDDNRSRDGTPLRENELHYSKAGYDLLAKRYVEKIKALVQ